MVKLPNFEIEKYSKELKSHVNNCDKNLVNSNKALVCITPMLTLINNRVYWMKKRKIVVCIEVSPKDFSIRQIQICTLFTTDVLYIHTT